MTDLTTAYRELRAALAPFGIEINHDVLDLWRDREQHGHPPLPSVAVRRLAELAVRLLPEPPP
jgi:hypothetical protein